MPDFDPMGGLTLIDPRYSPDQIVEELPYYRRGIRQDSVVVLHEPSLFPTTIEADALGMFCLRLYNGLCLRHLDDYETRFVAESLALIDTAEHALHPGAALDGCYEFIRGLAAWHADAATAPRTAVEKNTAHLAADARLFLAFKARFPAVAPTPVADDADDIDVSVFAR